MCKPNNDWHDNHKNPDDYKWNDDFILQRWEDMTMHPEWNRVRPAVSDIKSRSSLSRFRSLRRRIAIWPRSRILSSRCPRSASVGRRISELLSLVIGDSIDDVDAVVLRVCRWELFWDCSGDVVLGIGRQGVYSGGCYCCYVATVNYPWEMVA